MQEQFPQMIELGSSENRKYFRSIDNYSNLSKIKDNVTILKFESPLHFANSSRFVDKVCEVYTQFDNHLSSMKIIKSNEKLDEKLDENEEPIKECLNKDKKNFIILDCSSISYLDTMGLDALKKVEIESNLLRIEFYLTNLNENIITLFDKCNENEVPKKNNIFPTVNDALEYIENFGQN